MLLLNYPQQLADLANTLDIEELDLLYHSQESLGEYFSICLSLLLVPVLFLYMLLVLVLAGPIDILTRECYRIRPAKR